MILNQDLEISNFSIKIFEFMIMNVGGIVFMGFVYICLLFVNLIIIYGFINLLNEMIPFAEEILIAHNQTNFKSFIRVGNMLLLINMTIFIYFNNLLIKDTNSNTTENYHNTLKNLILNKLLKNEFFKNFLQKRHFEWIFLITFIILIFIKVFMEILGFFFLKRNSSKNTSIKLIEMIKN